MSAEEAREAAKAEYESGIRAAGSKAPGAFAAGFGRGWDAHAEWQASREGASIAEVKRRLIADGYADADRVRAALLHIEAFETGRAQASREVTDTEIEAATQAIHDNECSCQDKGFHGAETQAFRRNAARAALVAAREVRS